MTEWRSIHQALEFAIGAEQAAVEFYTRMAAEAKMPGLRETFQDFAREEVKHKSRLKCSKPARRSRWAARHMPISKWPTMTLEGALLLAMQKEKASFKLYSDLAAGVQDAGIKAMFLTLAQEEARHKLSFELAYDDMLTEN
jgi:rubrerythrin